MYAHTAAQRTVRAYTRVLKVIRHWRARVSQSRRIMIIESTTTDREEVDTASAGTYVMRTVSRINNDVRKLRERRSVLRVYIRQTKCASDAASTDNDAWKEMRASARVG